VVKLKSRDQSFGWCAVTTATGHAVEDETAPLAVQPAEVGTNRCAGVPATGRSGVYEKSDGACTSSWKMAILSSRKASAEPSDGIFRQKLAKATYVNSYRGGPLLYTNPPGVSLNRLELKKQMRFFFAQRLSASCKKMFWGKFLA
jgi:hypothetical protein